MKGMPHFRQYPMGDTVPGYIIDQDDPQQKVQREIAVEPGEYIVRRESVNALGVDNMELLNHADGAHGALNKLMVSASLVNHQPQDNTSVKTEANGFPIADSPVRQRVDATRQMQDGGPVEEGRSVRDYLGSLQENYQKYQGDVMTEAGDSRFNPSGQFTREGLAEEYNFPLEEAKFDTLYGYGTPGARDAAININLPNWKIKHTSHMSTDKYGEFEESERKIKDQMTKEHSRASIDLGNMLGGDYGEAIEAEKAGYLDMGPYEQHEYTMGKSRKVIEAHRKREEEKKKEREASPEYRKMMMEGLGMKSDEEYDKFLEMKRRLGGGYQTGGEVSKPRMSTRFDAKSLSGVRPEKFDYERTDSGGYDIGGIYSVPAEQVGSEGGPRFYLGEGSSRNPSLAKSKAGARAMFKMASSPADSIPQAMVESYFDDPDGYKQGGQVKGDVATGYWGPKGAYNEALRKAREEDMGSNDLKALSLLEQLRLLNAGTGVEPERLEQLNPERPIKRRESLFESPDSSEYNMPTIEIDPSGFRTPIMRAPSDNYSGSDVKKNLNILIPYLQSYGRMKTPAQERDEFLYDRLGVDPENPPMQLQGLKGRALLQRYGNEQQ